MSAALSHSYFGSVRRVGKNTIMARVRQSLLFFVWRCSLKLFWFSFIPVCQGVGFSFLSALAALVVLGALKLPAKEASQSEPSTATGRRALDPLVAEER